MSRDTPGKITVMVVDDHPLLREGVSAVIEPQDDMLLVGEASNGREAIDGYRRWRPDVTLMDLQMPHLGGLEALGRIWAEFPQARIIILTTYAGDEQALRALKAGAVGYLLKSGLRRDLISTIREVHRGQRYLHPDVASAIALGALEDKLSEREIAVLQLVAGGNSNKRIAYSLMLSEETVKSHMKNIITKLGVSDRTHAVVVAARRGIIEL